MRTFVCLFVCMRTCMCACGECIVVPQVLVQRDYVFFMTSAVFAVLMKSWPTDQPTDEWIDKVSYSDALPNRKSEKIIYYSLLLALLFSELTFARTVKVTGSLGLNFYWSVCPSAFMLVSPALLFLPCTTIITLMPLPNQMRLGLVRTIHLVMIRRCFCCCCCRCCCRCCCCCFVVYCCSSVIHATIGIKVGVVYQELPSIADAYLSMNKQKTHLHITVKKH